MHVKCLDELMDCHMLGTILCPMGMLTKETYNSCPTENCLIWETRFILEMKRSVNDQGLRVIWQTLRLWNEVQCKWRWVLSGS